MGEAMFCGGGAAAPVTGDVVEKRLLKAALLVPCLGCGAANCVLVDEALEIGGAIEV